MNRSITPDKIDSVIHEPARLAIVSTLAVAPEMSFKELKASSSLSDGNLSAHARTLELAGYIKVNKSFKNRRPLTTMRLTRKGRAAFNHYLDTLEHIVEAGRKSEKKQ